MIKLYLNEIGYFYNGVSQKIGTLPKLSPKDRIWTILGAALVELVENKHKDVTICTDQEYIKDEWGKPSNKVCILVQKYVKSNNIRVILEIIPSNVLSNNISTCSPK